MNSLVKVPPYSKLNFQGKMFFTQSWCNITLNCQIYIYDDGLILIRLSTTSPSSSEYYTKWVEDLKKPNSSHLSKHFRKDINTLWRSSWPWSYGSWIYNYLCNRCLCHYSCEFEPRSWRVVIDTTLCDKVCQWLTTGRWFSPGISVSTTNKTDCHDITEILLKVALNTITITPLNCVPFKSH